MRALSAVGELLVFYMHHRTDREFCDVCSDSAANFALFGREKFTASVIIPSHCEEDIADNGV